MNKRTIVLEDGIRICRLIEQAIVPVRYHCALGGSLMYRGHSEKDVDVIIYPRNNGPIDIKAVERVLIKNGFEHAPEHQTASQHPGQNVFPMISETGIRVDMFYVERPSIQIDFEPDDFEPAPLPLVLGKSV